VQKNVEGHEDNQSIGASCGGQTTKIHTVVDGLGNPVAFRRGVRSLLQLPTFMPKLPLTTFQLTFVAVTSLLLAYLSDSGTFILAHVALLFSHRHLIDNLVGCLLVSILI